MLRHQQREVRVRGVLGGVLVAVSVHGDDAVRVLVDDDAVGVHAERAHHVLKLLRAVDDLALIELVRQMGEDLRRKLHAHADVHAVGVRGDAHVPADALHPLRAAAPDGDDALARRDHAVLRLDGVARTLVAHALDRRVEAELHALLQLVVDVFQHDIVDVRSEVAHLRIEQMQPVFEAHRLDLRVRGGIELRALSAVADIDGVHVLHQVDGLLLADVFIERAAELVRDVVLAVGERARAAEAAHDAAHGALDAGLHLLPVDGALALCKLPPELHDADLQLRIALGELVSREDAAGTGADDENVVIICMVFHLLHFL